MLSISQTWGTRPDERAMSFPCDRLIAAPDAALYRGITIRAPAAIVFRWLCQMRVAPYSYDWLDNGGRRSPRHLTPGLDELAAGQDIMGIFELVEFVRDEQLTMRMKAAGPAREAFGDVAGSYCIMPTDPETCRLLVKLIVRYPPGIRGWAMSEFLPWGDLIMMRRQLLNFKMLAEGMGEEGNREARAWDVRSRKDPGPG